MRQLFFAMKRFTPLFLVAHLPGSALAAVITLSNGDVLNATVSAQTDSIITISHPILGTITLPRANVLSVVDDATAVAESMPAEVEIPAVTSTDVGLLGTGLLRDWNRKLEFGVNGADGKNNNRKFRAGFAGNFEDKATRWVLNAIYVYDEAEGVTSEKDFYAELTRDWLRPASPWFSFANARYDWDEFQDWDHRLHASGGIGYQFRNDETWLLSGRTGLGVTRSFGGEREVYTPEATLGMDGHWRIARGQQLQFRSTFYPNLEDWGEFRNISGMDWEMKLATDIDLSVKIGFSNEYDSLADSDDDKNDFKYYGGLVWGF